MSFFDFLKNFLGLRGRNATPFDPPNSGPDHGNEFKKPVWIDEYEEEDDDILSPQHGMHPFPILTDPIEIHRYFEQQMQEMQRMLQGFTFFSPSSIFDEFVNGNERRIPGALELPPEDPKSLRDHYLKHSDDKGKLKRQDEDLDSRVSSGGLGKILDDEVAGNQITPASPVPKFRFFSQSVITHTIRKADGSVETRTTKKLSDGTEETTVKVQKPDGSEEIHTETNLLPKNEFYDYSGSGGNRDFMYDVLNNQSKEEIKGQEGEVKEIGDKESVKKEEKEGWLSEEKKRDSLESYN
ncbi:hypothetical protein J437_LFUL001063 [Ladona fulva]|uniref:Uncharacterized protein n=1 Tax=Ladona fulva TaxID=123851 RepID=A0A8K0P0Q8_LADFU|nr:hypothetical protein J437_LFUL001063 [Ladona fulva]